MSSLTCTKKWQSRAHNNKFDAMLTAHGQLSRRIGPLLPTVDGVNPKCVQAYFCGGDDATKWRMTHGVKNYTSIKEKKSYETLFKLLHCMLKNEVKNTYLESFYGVKEYVEKKLKNKIWDVNLSIHATESAQTLKHQGRLTGPVVKEIAILMNDSDDLTKEHKRMVTMNYRHKKDDNTHLSFIPDYHRSYDPLQYPLIYPCGQDGWHLDCKHTCLQHTSFQLHDRQDENKNFITNPILRGKSLTQQYVVDQFAKIELSRLNYIKNNQKEMRAELYNGLKDAVTKNDGENIGKIGKKVILPSSFISGDRFMHQHYQDAISLLRRFGKPHLFITMTTNPDWREIKENLRPGEKAIDRPDIVARVFKLKKQQLIRDIQKEMIFGKCIARIHTIEFQKRGYPHIHLIIWLADKNHMTPEEIDQIINAEIPDKMVTIKKRDEQNNSYELVEPNPLHTLVTDMMLHGPCGPLYPNKACMREGVCKSGFPKEFLSKTELSEDSKPLYRRRSPEQGGNKFTKYIKNEEHTFTNAHVVPHNKYLLYKYRCHINVECVDSIHAIKYLFKYIVKGNDSATFTIESKNTSENKSTDIDKIKLFQNKRYTSAGEGTWRIFCNEICERFPPSNQL